MLAQILSTLEHQISTYFIGAVAAIPKLIVATLIWAAALWLARSISHVAERWMSKKISSRRSAIVSRLLARIVFTVLCLFGILLGLSVLVPSFGLSDFLGFLGVSGVAIGLAFREVLQSFFAGVIIAFSGTFAEGDSVEIGDIRGKVEEIQLRATILKGDSGERVIVPNGIVLVREVRVISFEGQRRKELLAMVDVNTDLEVLIPAMSDGIKMIPGVASDPTPTVFVRQVEGDKIHLLIRWWVVGEWGSGTKTRGRVTSLLRSQLAQLKQ